MKKEIKGEIIIKSPIHHGSDENAGIDRLYRRMDIFVNNRLERIPIISGNSIRGIMRDLLAYHLIQFLGLKKLSLVLYDLLFSGGSLKKGATTGKVEVEKINKIRELFPFLTLFGGGISNHIMQGSFNCGIAFIICKQTNYITNSDSDKNYIEFISEDFATRQDNALQDSELINNFERKDAQQMKYNYEIIISGAKFYHEFILNDISDIVNSCFFKGLELLKDYGFLGGKCATGYGKVEYKYNYDTDKNNGLLYEQFLNDKKEEILNEGIKLIL